MLRDKRHCSQVLRFEAGSTNCKQAQLSQLLHRHTVPTAKKNISVASIWLNIFSFYIAHLRLTIQTVGVQNPKHDCVQLPCCRHNTWKQWDNTRMLGKWLYYWSVAVTMIDMAPAASTVCKFCIPARRVPHWHRETAVLSVRAQIQYLQNTNIRHV